MDWLITNEEEVEYEVYDSELFWNNGIISPYSARIQLIYSVSEHETPNCPFCGENNGQKWYLANGGYSCKVCHKNYSDTSGRYLDNTKLPLTHWWRFCWKISKSKRYNSLDIARDLEVTQKTAWGMINTLKQAMKDNGIEITNSAVNFDNRWDVMRLIMQPKKITNELILND